MLADAISAEGFKLIRNRRTLFFGFLFVPLGALVAGILGQMFMRQQLSNELLTLMPMDMANQTVAGFAQAGGPMTILFALIGAATLFAGEYRWETWRLLIPRATRTDWLGAKAVVFGLAALATVLLIGIFGVISNLFGALSSGQRIVFDAPMGEFVRALAGHTLVSWLQLMLTGGLAALAGVVTRSMLGALMAPLAVSLGLAFAQLRLPVENATGDDWWRVLLIPGHAFEYARMFITGAESMPGQTVAASTGGLALAGLALWLLIGFGGALLVFVRQDLSKE